MAVPSFAETGEIQSISSGTDTTAVAPSTGLVISYSTVTVPPSAGIAISLPLVILISGANCSFSSGLHPASVKATASVVKIIFFMLDDFRRTLKAEGTFGPSDELLDRIIDIAEPVALKPGEVLIGYGQFDTNVYIVKEGILQLLYFDGEKEVTFGFAFPGTVLLSPHSFYMGKPAVMQVESCRIASAVMKIDKSRFEKLLEESHEFARWMLNLAIGQIYTSELKVTYVSGSTEDRYKSLLKIRPDIITSVSANRLASYLGITPSWMCKLRKKLLYE